MTNKTTPADSLLAELKRPLSHAYYNGRDHKGYSQAEEDADIAAVLKAFATYVRAVKPEKDYYVFLTNDEAVAHEEGLNRYEAALVGGLERDEPRRNDLANVSGDDLHVLGEAGHYKKAGDGPRN